MSAPQQWRGVINDREVLAEKWPDGSLELSTRAAGSTGSWGPPTVLEPVRVSAPEVVPA